MRPPFPGMDPWLEHPDIWPDLHTRLITAISDTLMPRIRPRYVVRVEARTATLSSRDIDRLYRADVAVRAGNLSVPGQEAGVAVWEHPDVKRSLVIVPMKHAIEETFLTIQEVSSHNLVTVIEVLSPTNKKTKKPRAQYLDKRDELLDAKINFVEIDLLRGGQPMPLQPQPESSDYRILICRSRVSRRAEHLRFSIRAPIPTIPIPLLPGDAEPNLDLNQILHALYERAGYDLSIDYRQPPQTRLRQEDQLWAAAILARTADSDLEHSPRNGS